MAGSRRDFDGDDRDRPLTKPGWAQSRGLVAVLKPFKPTRLLSSPYARCMPSFEPLGDALGLDVEAADELAEGRSGKAIVLVRSLVAGPTVALSTHGDIAVSVLEALADEDHTKLPSSLHNAKGSTWVL